MIYKIYKMSTSTDAQSNLSHDFRMISPCPGTCPGAYARHVLMHVAPAPEELLQVRRADAATSGLVKKGCGVGVIGVFSFECIYIYMYVCIYIYI